MKLALSSSEKQKQKKHFDFKYTGEGEVSFNLWLKVIFVKDETGKC